MANYEIEMKGKDVEIVCGADTYQQEGQMTTFFATDGDRTVIDCWSTRLASYRTSEILAVRRMDPLDIASDAASGHVGEVVDLPVRASAC